jgi:hypothetical protein
LVCHYMVNKFCNIVALLLIFAPCCTSATSIWTLQNKNKKYWCGGIFIICCICCIFV